MYQYTNTDGTPVPRWVNNKLNTYIDEEYAEIYDRCVHALDVIFKEYNKEYCSQCSDSGWKSVDHPESALRTDCGCCIQCAYRHGYARGDEFPKGIPFDTNWVQDYAMRYDSRNGLKVLTPVDIIEFGWGYFDPVTHSCSIPRHLRSPTCLRYFCKGPVGMRERVDALVDGICSIRYNWGEQNARIHKCANNLLKEMGL